MLTLLCFGINYLPRGISTINSLAAKQTKKKIQDVNAMTATSDPWHLNADRSTSSGPRFSPDCLSRSFRIRFTVFGYYILDFKTPRPLLSWRRTVMPCHVTGRMLGRLLRLCTSRQEKGHYGDAPTKPTRQPVS